jgi:tetratricopeptide (TPR) repeat protein
VEAADLHVQVDSRELSRIRHLLSGEHDHARCRGCGGVLSTVIAVVVTGDGWVVPEALDPLGHPPPSSVMSRSREQLAADGRWPREAIADTPAAEARPRVAEHLAAHLDSVIADLISAPTDDYLAVVQQRPADLTAEAMLAAQLWREELLAPSSLAVAPNDLDDRLARFQALTLAVIAAEVAEDGQATLAEMLDRYVRADLILPTTANLLSRYVHGLPWPEVSGPSQWTLSAVLASASRAAHQPDPDPMRTAQAYVRFGWAYDKDPADPTLARLALPDTQVRALLDVDALTDVASRLIDADTGAMPRLQRVLAAAALPRLLRTIAGSTPRSSELPLQALLAGLERAYHQHPSPRQLGQGLNYVLQALRSRGPSLVLKAVNRALELAEGSDEARALVLIQFGAALKELRQPQLFLDRVGREAEPWEQHLAPEMRLALAIERCNALRLTGQQRHARRLLEEVRHLPANDDDRRILALNLAILQRETGAPDTALTTLEQLLEQVTQQDARFEVLQALASARQFVGDGTGAVAALEQALTEATGRHPPEAARIRADLATWRAAAGQPIGDLSDLDSDAARDPRVVLGYGAAIAAALERSPGTLDRGTVDRVTTLLQAARKQAERAGDRSVQANALRVLGAIYDQLADPQAASAWQSLVDLRGAADADPVELAALAHHRLQSGDVDAARTLLAGVPAALVNELGEITDLGAVLDATGRLRAKLRDLADDVLRLPQPTPGDIRLVAELQRDALGQVVTLARNRASRQTETISVLNDPSSDATPSPLADPPQRLYVLEWLETRSGLVGYLSSSGRGQPAAFTSVSAIPGDPGQLARRMRTRLNGWRTDRAGEPLDYRPWRDVEQWLHALLPDATDGDHLIVIENEVLAGLPWHAVTDSRWTTSYSPGWHDLIRARDNPRRPHHRISLVSVPAYGESADLISAFATAIHQTQQRSHQQGTQLHLLEGIAATRERVFAALNHADLAILQCHGLQMPRDTALMVAADGHLPPQTAAGVDRRTRHRISWRDLQGLSSAPDVVLSAACSSGATLVRGLGERLGLYGALRHAGTRAVVAPAWDCHPTDVLPLLDRVHALISTGTRLAPAVKQASAEAETDRPPWRARMLAIEGDWT